MFLHINLNKMSNPKTKVFQNDDLRRYILKYILKYIIPKKCEMCRDKIRQGNIWELNNPNIKIFS